MEGTSIFPLLSSITSSSDYNTIIYNDPLLPPIEILIKKIVIGFTTITLTSNEALPLHFLPILILILPLSIILYYTFRFPVPLPGIPHHSKPFNLSNFFLNKKSSSSTPRRPLSTRIQSRSSKLLGPSGMYTSSFYNLTLLHCPTSSSITSLLNSKSSGGNKGGEYQHFEVFFGSSVFTSTNTDKKWRDRRKNLGEFDSGSSQRTANGRLLTLQLTASSSFSRRCHFPCRLPAPSPRRVLLLPSLQTRLPHRRHLGAPFPLPKRQR